MSVFKKSGSSGSLPGLTGVKKWINGVTLTSSGCASLDKIIGGGLSLSCIHIFEQDRFSSHSSNVASCFLAEGLGHKHYLFTASLDVDGGNILQGCPLNVNKAQLVKNRDRESKEEEKEPNIEDSLKIAWQYKKYMKPSNTPLLPQPTASNLMPFCQNFDLSKHEEESNLVEAKHKAFDLSDINDDGEKALDKLLEQIKIWLPSCKDNVGRIYISSLGSSLWGCSGSNGISKIILFLMQLQSLIRNTNVVVLITFPAHLYDTPSCRAVGHVADCVLRFDSFQGDLAYMKKQYIDMDGLLTIRKLTKINSLSSHQSETDTYGIKRDRRTILIERLHLPPEGTSLASSSSSVRSVPLCSSTSSSSGSKALDF